MAMSDYLESALLNHVLNGGSTPFTAPDPIYIALFTAAPSDSGGGTEVSGSGYARKSISDGFTVSGTATRGGNTALISFGTASGGSWGTVTHIGIFDAASGGNLLVHGALTASRTVNDGDTVEFQADALGLTFS